MTMKKLMMKIVISLIVVFAILRMTGVIQIHIPAKYYFLLILIPLIEFTVFVYIIMKLVKARRGSYPTLKSAIKAVLQEKIPFLRPAAEKEKEKQVN